MENKPPSVYEKLEELNQWTMSPTQNELMGDIMEAVNAIDNELISLAVELPPEQAEKLLDIQMRLY
ncbi:hypothetical protein [Bacillus cereus]|nr:hypothetical protein [Bacillus cereus]